MTSLDSFKSQKTLKVGGKTYVYYSLPAALFDEGAAGKPVAQ
jgi:hypothetical protein